MTNSTAELADVPELDLLYPLTEFYHSHESIPLAREEEGGSRMPEPYRGLLVHERDMTSTLEVFHGELMTLRMLDKARIPDGLLRKVVLVGRRSGRPAEFGAIRIRLKTFSSEARWSILEGRLPLGAILERHSVAYTSRPRLFFRLESDARIERKLELTRSSPDQPLTLYGRQNVLSDPEGQTLAEVVEILPPSLATAVGG
ncbi:MAG: hypothetical protein GY719_35910 [bacterium]|nr:hypothetical protein [bacterium]